MPRVITWNIWRDMVQEAASRKEVRDARRFRRKRLKTHRVHKKSAVSVAAIIAASELSHPPGATAKPWTEDLRRSAEGEVKRGRLTALARAGKRLLDIVVALTAGILFFPLILAIIVAVKLTSTGKIFYAHKRVGRDGWSFRVWKFRTMVEGADVVLAERLAADPALRIEWEQNHKLRADPRLTLIGNFLRRYSLDELPQLWNVLKGEMSIVGPRPICDHEIPKYADHFADYARVLPGITGLWQVSGRNDTTYQQRVHLDAYYANNWSLLLDVSILARTVSVVVSARGAY
jgi:Undecaprenyl-phosphate galactose phosphotransferase WbaP